MWKERDTRLASLHIDFLHSWEQYLSTTSSKCTQSQFKVGKPFEVRLTAILHFVTLTLWRPYLKKGAGGSCGLLPKCLAQDGCIVEAEVPQLSAALIKKHAGTEWASICREVLVISCITHRVAKLLCVCAC